ncbi:ROK family transcriptional regulator [Actinoalloteichus caeruleus]|uniref:Sugar kinase of the NBD/HSP70 family, may containing an N-terminal HTH domain n=1 Tax=Actinoalloteichus caeruleus DSM 43889 TaxID=1120930 RepID=A0ABT1JL52_ACTCY|nr:ROK family transcriptional regulator [Actinoalloteichus caeruleus]MCP2333243.1 Sugar kinase of the NBD/HSP70 family, may containing an N-terminal HTH domain [Actinoalloteichus caeruleus DSM 43889]
MNQSGPAGQHTVRRHNSALVLNTIATADGLSRASVAARTGLTKATVSSLVDRMITAGLVVDGGPEHRVGRGRRGTALSLSPTGPHGLGVEIGVDTLSCALVDLTGRVRVSWTLEVEPRGRTVEEGLSQVADLVGLAQAEAARLGVSVGGVGVAVPGLVESSTGLLRSAPNLGWRDVPLHTELRARTGVTDRPLLVGNEANLAGLAELWFGGREDRRDFVHVSGEIGIGAGLVVSGELFPGVRGFGGEIGHLSVDPAGPPCSCGGRGCLERLAGRAAVLAAAGVPAEPEGGGGDGMADLLGRLRDHDAAALTAVTDAGRWLGIAMADVINLVDIPTVVLGGTYARLEPWLRSTLLAELDRRVVSSGWAPIAVEPSVLGSRAAVQGAAGWVVRGILDDPEPFLVGPPT